MRLWDYISDNKIILLVCFASSLFFSVILISFGVGVAEVFLLWVCFAIILFLTMLCSYLKQRKRMKHLLSNFDSLDQKYLIAEIADKPETKLEKVYFRLLKIALKDMTDEVAGVRRQNAEYKDFIEQWIHEIKVPITGIQLLCENNKTEITRKIITQTELIEQNVERVLFYARLGNVEKDYLIKEISLKQCVMEMLARNKQFLIQNGVCVDTEVIPDTVYSDNKWVCFILNQIIFNSIKYRGRVLFGVITLLGSCMLITLPLECILKKCNSFLGFSISVVIFLLTRNITIGFLGFESWNIMELPDSWYRNFGTAYLGFPFPSFYSTDYFSLFPWYFLFLAGYFFKQILSSKDVMKHLMPSKIMTLEWIGAHSLEIYIIHQPLIYVVLLAIL